MQKPAGAKHRQGFTLVELLVVIAIIAVLAAVSVPVFTSLIEKAERSNDITLAAEANTLLAVEEIYEGKYTSMGEVLALLEKNGITHGEFKASAKDCTLAWSSAANRVLLLDRAGNILYPENLSSGTHEIWRLVGTYEELTAAVSAGHSAYFTTDISGDISSLALAGIDTGAHQLNGNITLSDGVANYPVSIKGKINGNLIIAVQNATVQQFADVSGKVVLASGSLEIAPAASVPIVEVAESAQNVKVLANSEASETVVSVPANASAEVNSTNDSAKPTYVAAVDKTNVTVTGTQVEVQENNTFEALQAALNAGGTVLLTSDMVLSGEVLTVPAGVEVVLHMAGKSITVTENYPQKRPIVNNGILTITGNGVVDSSASSQGLGAIDNSTGAILTIENGTFRGARYAGGSVIRNKAGATATINGGTFEESTYTLVNKGNMTINGGTVINKTCPSKKADAYAIHSNDTGAVLVINGGQFYGVQGALMLEGGKANIYDGMFSTLVCGENADHGITGNAFKITALVASVTCRIYGGTFSTEGQEPAAIIGLKNINGNMPKNSTVEIYGGIFRAPSGVEAFHYESSYTDLRLCGGEYYGILNTTDCLDGGYMVTTREDGSYIVVKK